MSRQLSLPLERLDRLPPIAEQRRRWRELEARRPALTLPERAEWDRLDSARCARLARLA